MTIISLFGAFLSFLAVPFFLRRSDFERVAIAVLLVLVHIAAAYIYYLYTKSNVADAHVYYYDDRFFSSLPWTSLNTVLLGKFVQVLKHSLGATYFDCFMVFQAFGAWGLIIMMKIFNEIYKKTGTSENLWPYLVLFIPSIQFWTSAIGKDAPTFLALSLCTWSVLHLRARVICFSLSLAILVLIRPQIALAICIAISVSSLLHAQFTLGRKIFLVTISLICCAMLLSVVRNIFSVDLVDRTSLAQFFEGRSAAEVYDTKNTQLGNIFVRLFSLLFRPLFFDARNILGAVASTENIGSVILFLYLFMNILDVRWLSKKVLFVRFCIFVVVILTCVLSVLNYNVGLGLRERIMITPALFSLLVSVYAFRKSKQESAGLKPMSLRSQTADPRPIVLRTDAD